MGVQGIREKHGGEMVNSNPVPGQETECDGIVEKKYTGDSANNELGEATSTLPAPHPSVAMTNLCRDLPISTLSALRDSRR
jgi:hypothetical protein